MHPSKATSLKKRPSSRWCGHWWPAGPASLPGCQRSSQLQRELMGLSQLLPREQARSQCHLHTVHLPLREPRCLLMAVSIWLI